MVMTFVLHPLSHYNSITEPRAQFSLSFLEDISIDFPSHFILSLINVYRDTATHDKLSFPSASTWIPCHFSVSFPKSPHFSVMCAIDATTVRQSKAQLKLRRHWTEMVTPHFYSNMHKIDTSVPHFFSHVRGTRIVVTPDIVYEILPFLG